MLDEATVVAVTRHEVTHRLGLCTCPCFDALMDVGKKLAEERELAAKLGSVSPIALAALMGADVSGTSEDEDGLREEGVK